MSQPPVTVPQVRSTVFPAARPVAVASAEAPTMAGVSWVRSSVASVCLDTGVAAGDVVDGDLEHAVNPAANAAATHRRQRGVALMHGTARLLWNDGELRRLHLEGLELTGATLRIF